MLKSPWWDTGDGQQFQFEAEQCGRLVHGAAALEHPETRTEASEALRGLIDAIVLTPDQGELQIKLRGNLARLRLRPASMMTAAHPR